MTALSRRLANMLFVASLLPIWFGTAAAEAAPTTQASTAAGAPSQPGAPPLPSAGTAQQASAPSTTIKNGTRLADHGALNRAENGRHKSRKLKTETPETQDEDTSLDSSQVPDKAVEIDSDKLGPEPDIVYATAYNGALSDNQSAQLARCAQLKRGKKATLVCVYAGAFGAQAPNTDVVETPLHPEKGFPLPPSRAGNWLLQVLEKRLGGAKNDLEKNQIALLPGWGAEILNYFSTGDTQNRPLVRVAITDSASSDASDANATFDAGLRDLRPKIQKALAQRDDAATALKLLNNIGSTSDVDLGLPLLTELEAKIRTPVGTTIEKQRPPVDQTQYPPLQPFLNQPDVPDALAKLLGSGYFQDGTDLKTSINALNDRINSPAFRTPPDGRGEIFPWKWTAAALTALLLLTALAFLVWPLPDWQERQAVERVGRKNHFLTLSQDVNRFLENADKGDHKIASDLRKHFIWLMTRGGYGTALNILKSGNDALAIGREDIPLVHDAVFRVKELQEIRRGLREELVDSQGSFRTKLTEAERARASLIGGADEAGVLETSASWFGLNRSEVSINRLTQIYNKRRANLVEFLGRLLPDADAESVAQRALQSGQLNLQSEISKLESLRLDAAALQQINGELQDYDDGQMFGLPRDRAKARAASARRTASTLRHLTDRHQVVSTSSDPETFASAADRALEDAVEGRSLKSANLEAKAQIIQEPDIEGTEDMSIGELVRKTLGRLSFWRRSSTEGREALGVSEAGSAALKAVLANETLKLHEAESALRKLEDLLGHILSKIADIDPDLARRLGMTTSAGYDIAVTQKVISSLDRELLILRTITAGLRAASQALVGNGRADVVSALHIDRICAGLDAMHADCMDALKPPLKPDDAVLDDEAKYRRIYLPRMSNSEIHLLFRADAILSTYYRDHDELRWLGTFTSLAANLVEIKMRQIGARLVRPKLLAKPSVNAVTRLGVEPEFLALKEVRAVLAPHISLSDGVVVDIYEIGIEAPYKSYAPRICVLNPAEWA